jgi:alcohol dehydrogenase class IV
MPGFDYFGVSRIVFGRGQRSRLPELLGALGTGAFIIYNGAPTAARAAELLGEMPHRLHRQRGEPTVADVDAAVESARAAGCDVIAGIGGGSAIDAAKAVAGLLANGGTAQDYMEVVGEGRRITRPAMPWVAMPTTAGTGAEATRNAVIGLPERRFKASIRSEHLLPRGVIIDPELQLDVPAAVTARSGMDALCQCIEACTSTGASPLTDPLALDGIRRAGRSIVRAVEHGDDLAAREDMALAALFSGVALTNAGLGAVHGLAAPLGANFPIPHGTLCAALLPGVMQANVRALRAAGDAAGLARYAGVGRALADNPHLDDAQAILFALRQVARLARRLGIPRLGGFGLAEQHVAPMVQLARKASSMRFNPVILSDNVLAGILGSAL